MRSQGAEAVYSGLTFREIVASVGEIVFRVASESNCKIPGEDQMGRPMKAAIWFPVITPRFEQGFYVECRHQNKNGSAEDKIESKCITISQHYDRPTVLVIDGSESHRMEKVARKYIGNGNLHDVVSLYGFWLFCLNMRDHVDPMQPTLFK